jgi:hypothetical protein
MLVMAKRKPKPPTASDGRAENKPIRIRGVLIQAVEARAADLVQDATQYINDAVRMRLEAEGHWPPPPPKPAK